MSELIKMNSCASLAHEFILISSDMNTIVSYSTVTGSRRKIQVRFVLVADKEGER